jgi:hypothetical protein
MACPSCGNPLDPGADECPRCGERFSVSRSRSVSVGGRSNPSRVGALRPEPQLPVVPVRTGIVKRLMGMPEAERTTMGGLTGALTAHPREVSVVLGAGAIVWGLRAAGILGPGGQSTLPYVLAALNLVLIPILMFNWGPVRVLAPLTVGAQVVLSIGMALTGHAVGWARELAFVLHAGVALLLVVGEPDAFRRRIGMVAGLLAALAAALGLATGQYAPRAPPVSNEKLGFRFLLPPGYELLTPEQLDPVLHAPPTPLGGVRYAFGRPGGQVPKTVFGILLVDPTPGIQLIGGCQSLWRSLGGTGALTPLARVLPEAFVGPAVVYELRTAQAKQGLLVCGRPDEGRFVALTVVTLEPQGDQAAKAFAQVGAGLRLK